MHYPLSQVTFVVVGASAKAEQRLAVDTNYWQEVALAHPHLAAIDFVFVGPEVAGGATSRLRFSALPLAVEATAAACVVRHASFKGNLQVCAGLCRVRVHV